MRLTCREDSVPLHFDVLPKDAQVISHREVRTLFRTFASMLSQTPPYLGGGSPLRVLWADLPVSGYASESRYIAALRDERNACIVST